MQDPYILLSRVNTELRDGCEGLGEVCEKIGLTEEEITAALAEIGYRYDAEQNRFR